MQNEVCSFLDTNDWVFLKYHNKWYFTLFGLVESWVYGQETKLKHLMLVNGQCQGQRGWAYREAPWLLQLTAVWKAVVAKAWNLGGTVILSIIFCVCDCFFCFPVLIQPFSLMVSQAGQVWACCWKVGGIPGSINKRGGVDSRPWEFTQSQIEFLIK